MKMKSFAATVAVSAAALGTLGAGSAFAATLYTTSAHTTKVAVNTTATGKSTTAINLFSGGMEINSCASSKLDLKLTKNSKGKVEAEITGGKFKDCAEATTVNAPWSPGLVITGDGTAMGSDTSFAAVVDNVSVDIAALGGNYAGSLTTGVSAVQPASGALQLVLDNAGTLNGPAGAGTATGTYALSGAAAAYSLGN